MDSKPNPKTCPMCGKPALNTSAFCSERCQLADLAKWLDGDYVVPSDNTLEDPGPSNGETTH